MKKILYILILLLMVGCKHHDNIELWNDLKVGDNIFHFTLVEFRNESQIICTGDQPGYLLLQFVLPDGTAVTRKHMLQCAEGYHAEYDVAQGVMLATLEGTDGFDGDYRAASGWVEIERHEFKTSIELHELRLVRQNIGDTIGIDDGYLSFDLSLL